MNSSIGLEDAAPLRAIRASAPAHPFLPLDPFCVSQRHKTEETLPSHARPLGRKSNNARRNSTLSSHKLITWKAALSHFPKCHVHQAWRAVHEQIRPPFASAESRGRRPFLCAHSRVFQARTLLDSQVSAIYLAAAEQRSAFFRCICVALHASQRCASRLHRSHPPRLSQIRILSAWYGFCQRG